MGLGGTRSLAPPRPPHVHAGMPGRPGATQGTQGASKEGGRGGGHTPKTKKYGREGKGEGEKSPASPSPPEPRPRPHPAWGTALPPSRARLAARASRRGGLHGEGGPRHGKGAGG